MFDDKNVPSEPRLLRSQDIARILNISVPSAYKLMEQGVLPVIRIGKSVRVHPDDLFRFINQQRERGC